MESINQFLEAYWIYIVVWSGGFLVSGFLVSGFDDKKYLPLMYMFIITFPTLICIFLAILLN
tara:strand:+ start:350 stop:535 length:186 start_codon:yes stop_codon:yes gene_type:complete